MTRPFYQKTPIMQSYVILSRVTIWWTVAANTFWILGLAITLAALSYHYWEAVELKHPFRQQWQTLSFQLAAWLGLALVCLGVGSASQPGWGRIGWFVLAGLCWLNWLFVLPWRKR